MANTTEHGRMIAAAAKAALKPLGCTRKGQSRVWYDDHGSWVIVVEFQPSAWARGSYLNVGISWLWRPDEVYDYHSRPGDFILYETATQFMPLVDEMAKLAAAEIQALRKQLRTSDEILRFIKKLSRHNGWPLYNAAVACALAGDTVGARVFFKRMQAWPTYGSDRELALKERGAALARLLDKPAQFRATIIAQIEARRAKMKLPPAPNCLDAWNSKAAQ